MAIRRILIVYGILRPTSDDACQSKRLLKSSFLTRKLFFVFSFSNVKSLEFGLPEFDEIMLPDNVLEIRRPAKKQSIKAAYAAG